ncbi:hypothetical protein L1987_32117 [Smallanthus sonchifolius]|uniref:Uncharacterized protein n=1 Tax=Smallanthus sonchifolius TaxID=185202 RepID=A0ACB9I8Z2_9ASTR|nr:hypothetical protein L1987_32117 [Smallanthus sonchifolius]
MVRLSQETVASSDPCSSSDHHCFTYDVFLSFRGEDTRKTFTDHLYAALKQAGIRTFRDDDAMDRGKLLGPELKKAIRESAISIIVFSRDYASSKWCLDEVLTIIQEQERLSSKHEVVPVFYDVEPSDVRNQTGSFEEAFGEYDNMIEAEIEHQKKNEWLEKVKAWRVSLKKAESLTGMVLANGYEAKFISEIVNVIRKKLNYKLLYIEDKLVGIENNVAAIESCIGFLSKWLGSFLNGKTVDVWEDALRKLEAVPNPDIQKVLQLSFDSLEDTNDKDLFLHLACFFVGEKKEFIVKLLAECDMYPVVGIQNLMDRCLLYIEDEKVMMHQLIKEMGQEVVRQESPKDLGKRSRLWNHQDSFNVLKENEGTKKLVVLDLRYSKLKEVWDVFKVVGSLKILNLSYSVELTKTPDFGGLPNLESLHLEGCLSEKLCAVEDCCKLESFEKVDRKVIRYLGLESILENGLGLGFNNQNAYTNEDSIKVSYEFGIFSAFVSGKTLPCFRYKEIGSIISFRVPSHPNGSRISGLNVSFMSTLNLGRSKNREVEVNNKTKVLVWKYSPTIHVTCNKTDEFYYVWLSLWRIGNLLDDGDEIVVSINDNGGNVVEECCVNFVYEDYDDDHEEVGEENQKEMDEEKKEIHCVFNHISWTDRMRVEISDYVHSGKTYSFNNVHGTSDLIVDWWGVRENWWCRQISAGVPVLI